MTMTDPFTQLAAQAPHPRESVLEAIRQDLKSDPTPRRSLSRGQRIALSAGALSLGLLLTSVNALLTSPRVFVLAAAAFSLSVSGLLLAGAVPGQGGRLGPSARRGLVLILSIFVFTTLALQAESFLPLAEFVAADSVRQLTACATHSLISGVVGATALMYFWRRTDPFSPGLTGALLGLFGGAAGTVSVGLLCSSVEGMHLTLGHGIALLVLAGAGVVVGRKWLAP